MGIVPKPIEERITFYQTKLPALEENALAVGTTPQAVAELAAKVADAADAYREQYAAQQAAVNATQRLKIALGEMNAAGASIILQVRSKAQLTRDPGVYTLASMPRPAHRSRMGRPGSPGELSTAIGGLGELHLKWKCKNPRGSMGTLYRIHRRTSPTASFEPIGVSGTKAYVDYTIPKGATALEYQIQAVRSTTIGVSAVFPVSFGSNGIAPPPPSMRQQQAQAA